MRTDITEKRKARQALFYGRPLTTDVTILGMGVGTRIRALRKTAGMAQGRLAALAGMPQSTLSSIEHGDSAIPRGDHLSRLASILKVNQEWLITGQGSPVPLVQPQIEESELLQIYRDLGEPNRAALLATARALLGSQPIPTPASPLRRHVKQK